MPDHSPSTDERASLAQPSQSSSPLECTSHLGFSLVVRILCNDGLIGTGHLLGHTGFAETIPEQPGVPTRHNKDVGLLVAEFDRGRKGHVHRNCGERQPRKGPHGKGPPERVQGHRRRTEITPDNGKPRKGII